MPRGKKKITNQQMQKIIAELPEQKKKIEASRQLRADFLRSQRLLNIDNEIKRLEYYKNAEKTPSLRDLFITNKQNNYNNYKTLRDAFIR